jgi:hypothetical protein
MGVIGVMGLVTCLGRKTTEEDEIAGEGMPSEVSFMDYLDNGGQIGRVF